MMFLKNKRFRSWVYVVVWVIFIYSTLTIVRPICEYLRVNIPFTVTVNTLIIAPIILVIILLWRKCRGLSALTIILFALVFSMYLFGVYYLKIPEERVHFIQYGVLVFLIFQALKHDFRGVILYIGAFVLTVIFGTIDEGLQHILPRRYFAVADIVLNAISAFLGLCLIFIFEREIQLKKSHGQ